MGSGLVFFGWLGLCLCSSYFQSRRTEALGRGGRARADLCACVAGLSDAPLMQTSLPGAQVMHTQDSRCGVVTRPAGSVLPLPPSAPRSPINAKRAPPSLWHGDQSWEAKESATTPSPLQPRPLPTA